MFSLVTAKTADSLQLTGLFSHHPQNTSAVLHIHGFESDFYRPSFIAAEEETLSKENISFLTVETRGTSNVRSFFPPPGSPEDHERIIGSHFELLEEAFLDIDAWAQFLLNHGIKKIFLQGHSLGTYKITRYLCEGKQKEAITGLILLAPFDEYGVLDHLVKGSYRSRLENARVKLAQGEGRNYIPIEYENVTMSLQTFCSWLSDDEFSHVFDFGNEHYDFPLLSKIKLPVKLLVGSKDDEFYPKDPENPSKAIEIMTQHTRNFDSTLLHGCGHMFFGYEEDLSKAVFSFIQKVKNTS